jgi:serine/threonine protein kinase
MAPELFAEKVESGTGADIWSFGVIVYNMFFGFVFS